MKMMLAVAALMVAGSAQAATNLVTNGSFESGLADWTIVGTETQGFPPVAITYGDAAPYPNGAFGEAVPADNSVSLSPDPVGTRAAYFVSDFSAGQGLQQTVYLTPGKYQVGFSYYAPANGYANINDAAFSANIAGDALVNTMVSANPPTTWLNFSGTTKITNPGFYNVSFLFTTNGDPAKDVVIDRVYISAVPEPEAWALLVAGFAMVGFSARRRKHIVSA